MAWKLVAFDEAASRDSKINVRQVREALGLSQDDFWRVLGVTQSGGSRYEREKTMPKPVEILFRMVYLSRRPPKAN